MRAPCAIKAGCAKETGEFKAWQGKDSDNVVPIGTVMAMEYEQTATDLVA